jgi:hypothetical protein
MSLLLRARSYVKTYIIQSLIQVKWSNPTFVIVLSLILSLRLVFAVTPSPISDSILLSPPLGFTTPPQPSTSPPKPLSSPPKPSLRNKVIYYVISFSPPKFLRNHKNYRDFGLIFSYVINNFRNQISSQIFFKVPACLSVGYLVTFFAMFSMAIVLYRWFLMVLQPFYASPPGPGLSTSDNVFSPVSVPEASNNVDNEGLLRRLAELEERVRQSSRQPAGASYNTLPPKEPKLKSPSPFKGDKAEAEEFILKCQSIFDICNRTYFDDKTKLAFVFNLLEGDAYQWLKPALLSLRKPTWTESWEDFKNEFFKNFADSDIKETSRQKLKALKQTTSASNYATDFKKYALYLDWSDEALRQAFFDGLKYDVQDRLLSPQRFTTFYELIDAAIEWDNLLFQRRRSHPALRTSRPFATAREVPRTSLVNVYKPVEPSVKGPWPMDVDTVQPRKPLTQSEKDDRRRKSLCLYCGKPGHQVQDCRVKPSSQKLSALDETPENENPHQ